MTAYEDGDTVEVTLRGKVSSLQNTSVKKIEIEPYHFVALNNQAITSIKLVEKAKEPVYTNSDATEFHIGDVYVVNRNGEDRVGFVGANGRHYYTSVWAERPQHLTFIEGESRRLLATRDKVVV